MFRSNQNKYYVYLHVDPTTEEVVYVGKGKYGRAWDVTRCRNQHHEHQQWMLDLTDKGFLPTDWVAILIYGLSEEMAFKVEKDYLHSNGILRFCRNSGERQHRSKLTDEQAREIYMRASKENHSSLAKEFGISRTGISMISTRKQWRATTAGLDRA